MIHLRFAARLTVPVALIHAVMLLPVVLALPLAEAEAQSRRNPTPGDRVRVNVCESGPGIPCRYLTGSFVSWTPDRIVIRDSTGTDLQIAAGPRSKVEMSRGRQSRLGHGLMFGFLGGVGVGALATLACVESADDGASPCAGWVPIGAGAGLLVGAIVGSGSRERWAAATRPDGITIVPSRSGVRLGLSHSF